MRLKSLCPTTSVDIKMNLEFATNEELVQELMARTTFVGVLVYSKEQNKSHEVHDDWIVRSTLDAKQTNQILAIAKDETENPHE